MQIKPENDTIDIDDKLISLWIAFNGWMKSKFGEPVKDTTLISRLKDFHQIKSVFKTLYEQDTNFNSSFRKLKRYTVLDMRYPDDNNRNKEFDRTFESLIDVIYRVRCNLFHGRKGDENELKGISSDEYTIISS